MSLIGLFDVAKSSLFTSQTALAVTSNNIANINTPGYNRQEVVLDVNTPSQVQGGYVGNGVTVTSIKRDYDNFLQAQILGQNQNQGRSSALATTTSQVEQVFNESQNTGLSTSLTDFFNSWQDVAADPTQIPQRATVLQKASTLVTGAQGMENSLIATQKQINANVSGIAGQINTIASGIATLNGQIVQIEGNNTTNANDLRDQRDGLMNQLGGLTEISSYEDNNGSLTVTMGMRTLVEGTKTNTLSTKTNADGNPDLYLDNANITSNITKGQLGGLISARDDVSSNSLSGLRKLVASITQQVNLAHEAGFGLDSSTGNDFFKPVQLYTKANSAGADVTSASVTDLSQLTLDEYNITFDASSNYSVTDKQSGAAVASGAYTSGSPIAFAGIQVTISGAVTANDSIFISPLTNAVKNFGVAVTDPQKVAASSSAAELPANNTNALQVSQLLGTGIANLGGSTFTDFYGGLVAHAGSASSAASDSLTYDNNMLSDLKGRSASVSGVNLDEEAVNLMQYQRAYEAGAQIIKITNELLQTVLGMIQ